MKMLVILCWYVKQIAHCLSNTPMQNWELVPVFHLLYNFYKNHKKDNLWQCKAKQNAIEANPKYKQLSTVQIRFIETMQPYDITYAVCGGVLRMGATLMMVLSLPNAFVEIPEYPKLNLSECLGLFEALTKSMQKNYVY